MTKHDYVKEYEEASIGDKEAYDNYMNFIDPYPKELRLGIEKGDETSFILTIPPTNEIPEYHILVTKTTQDKIEIVMEILKPYLTLNSHEDTNELVSIMKCNFGLDGRTITYMDKFGRLLSSPINHLRSSTATFLGVFNFIRLSNKDQSWIAFLEKSYLKFPNTACFYWSDEGGLYTLHAHLNEDGKLVEYRTEPRELEEGEEPTNLARWFYIGLVDGHTRMLAEDFKYKKV